MNQLFNPKVVESFLRAAHDWAYQHIFNIGNLKGFGDNAVDLDVRIWINDPANDISNVKSELLLGIWDRFREHGIDIPFPQRDIHIVSGSPPSPSPTGPVGG